MKNIFFLICFFLAMHAGAQKTQAFIGKWKASPKGNVIYLEFGADSTFVFTRGKDTLGGKSFQFGEGEASSSFKIDTSARPMALDLVVKQKSSGSVISTMEGIFEFIGPGKMRVRMSMDGSPRPKTFMPKGNEETVIFVKQK
jgi:uncharacterized protein (TIGR03067 family)